MGEVTVLPAKTGAKTASFGSFRIHSAYDPQKEAARFLDSQINSFRRNGTVIILGAGLGYLDTQLTKQRPDLKIISCHLISELYYNRIAENVSVSRWKPHGTINIEKFLFERIGELDIPGLRIIEWPASIKAVPEIAQKVSDAVSMVIRRYAGNITTTTAFGKLWIRNTMRNFLEIDRISIPQKMSGATVIAAAGHSLEKQLEILSQYRSKFNLWALPSSLPALERANIVPDLVFSTDPGHWARLHGRFFPEGTPVAMPLAAIPLPAQSGAPILLAQKTIGEESLLTEDDWHSVCVPQSGSVVITAIDTWRQISNGPLVLAGLDLCWFDLCSHVRPHSFDGWFASSVHRTIPSLTHQWNIAEKAAPKRNGQFRMGFSLATYADWFHSNHFDAPVYRLTVDDYKYPDPLGNIEETDASIFKNFKSIPRGRYKTQPAPITSDERKKRVCSLLRSWKRTAAMSDSAKGKDMELLYTLDPRGVLDMIRMGSISEQVRLNHRNRVQEIIQELLRPYG